MKKVIKLKELNGKKATFTAEFHQRLSYSFVDKDFTNEQICAGMYPKMQDRKIPIKQADGTNTYGNQSMMCLGCGVDWKEQRDNSEYFEIDTIERREKDYFIKGRVLCRIDVLKPEEYEVGASYDAHIEPQRGGRGFAILAKPKKIVIADKGEEVI